MGISPKSTGEKSQKKRSQRCLIVEDDRVMRELLRASLLENQWFQEITEASEATTALEICQRSQPEVVVTDLMLPGMSGLQLISKIFLLLPEAKIMVLSADLAARNVQEVLASGAHGFVAKTSSMDNVLMGLEEVCAGRSYLCPDSVRSLSQAPVRKESLPALSAREEEFLKLYAKGKSVKETADEMKISVKTAHNHFSNLKNKLGLYDAQKLVHHAIQTGLIPPTVFQVERR
jgi:DNA-binding NarL/FixJ family response regulator